MKIDQLSKVHFVGIHGVGMSGLAVICQEMGKEVKGSDKPKSEIYGNKEELFAKKGIEAFYGFDAKNLDWGPDIVVAAASFSADNPEIAEAKKRNIPVIPESELRGELMREKKGIAVSGVHGKTTTTAILSYIFTKADLEPTFLIGTNQVPNLGTHARFGKGSHVIIEADEYQKGKDDQTPKFLDFHPHAAITTSIEWEHVDMYPDEAAVEAAFAKLVAKIPADGYWVACTDWPAVARIAQGTKVPVETYGTGAQAKWRMANMAYDGPEMSFDVIRDGTYFDTFHTKLSGAHNALNALACIVVALRENIPLETIKDALANFVGSERRFEVGARDGITYIDDYAHHPTEIKATLEAARARYPKNELWCVYQPHMASRTYHMKSDIAKSFEHCNKLVITDIFASAREKNDLIKTSELFEETVRHHDDVVHTGDLAETAKYLKFKAKKGDVVITMGAGDVYKVRDELMGE